MRRRRARETRGTPALLAPLSQTPGAAPLSPRDLAAVLAAELAAVQAASKAGGFERARVTVALVQAALKCFEMSDLAARLEAVEAALEVRDEKGKPYASTN